MIRNFTDDAHDIADDYGHELACRLLDHVRERMIGFQAETGHLYNLEATPAEGTTYRLAKEDRKRFPGILQAGTEDAPYYTNSSQLPAGSPTIPSSHSKHQEALQSRYTGGTVLHLYMGERISSSETCKTLVRRVLERFHMPYITITPTFSICPVHGYLAGAHKFCPKCDARNSCPQAGRSGLTPLSNGRKYTHARPSSPPESLRNPPNRRRTPSLRNLDAGDGLSPPDQRVQSGQEKRAGRARPVQGTRVSARRPDGRRA